MMRFLAPLAALPPGTARGFPPAEGQPWGLFAVHGDTGVRVYVNACPHLGISLEWADHQFLSADGRLVVCSVHGAEFRPDDGLCLRGPCAGERLTALRCEIRAGGVWAEEPDPARVSRRGQPTAAGGAS